MADVAELIVALKLRDGVSSGLGQLNGQLKGMSGGLSQVGRGIGQVGHGLDTALTRGAIAAGGALAFVVKSAVDFEDAFTGVSKTVDASKSELAGLSDEIRAMSREMPIAATELAAIAETAGALGIAVADIDEFTRTAALIGVTTDVSSDQAATALGQLSNVLNLTGKDYERFASTLVDLGNKGASTESEILAIATRAGAAGDLIGLSADQMLAFGSAVANLGIEAEAGGSALQKFFIDSLTNIQDQDLLGVMAKTAETTGVAFKQAFEKDAAGALNTFLIGLDKLDEAAQIETLQSLGFNDVRITRMLLGFANDTDNLTDSLKTAESAFKANTALQVEADRKFANTASQLKILKNNVTDAAVTIGHELLPVISKLSGEFVGFLNQPGTQQGLKDFATDLAVGIRGLANELKGTDFSGIIGGMKLAAGVAKGAFDVFNALPGPVKQIAIAALVANKVTGGAVGSAVRGLKDIVLGSLRTINAANVTVIGKNVIAPGGLPGGGGTPGGGLLGGLKTGLAVASPVLVGVAAVEVVNFEDMRGKAISGLEANLDDLERGTLAASQASIDKIQAQIDQERPWFEGLLFNTHVKPVLERELAELKATQVAIHANERAVMDLAASERADTVKALAAAAIHANEQQMVIHAASERAETAAAVELAESARITGQIISLSQSERTDAAAARGILGGHTMRLDSIAGSSSQIDFNTRSLSASITTGIMSLARSERRDPVVNVYNTTTLSPTVIQQGITQTRIVSGATAPTPN